jgi:hypothetical protein
MTNPAARAPLTRHITAVFRTATPKQLDAGMSWYADAHAFAAGLASTYGVSVAQASGIISALSPLNPWGNNKRLAERFVREGGLTEGYLSRGLASAQKILDGTDVLDVLRANKTRNFFMSILTEGDQGITIDRHAYSLAVNTRFGDNMPKLSDKMYAATVEMYRRATVILSAEYDMRLTPAQTQAVSWVQYRSRFWSENSFD